MSWLRLNVTTAAIAAGLLVVAAIGLRPFRRRWSTWAAAAALETSFVCGLFALWQAANHATHTHVAGGLARGRAIWHAERWLHVPNEAWFQQLILGHPDFVRIANYYYDTAHLTSMAAFLIWFWVRHRDRYAQWRNTLVLFTAMSLLVQIVPVAPPRLIGGTGMLDTAMFYGQSVYAFIGSGVADQYAAMPSIHVGWAVLIGAAMLTESRSRWRWIGPIHAALTVFVVVATANHYWADGAAAVVLLALSWWLSSRLRDVTARRPLPAQIQQGAFS